MGKEQTKSKKSNAKDDFVAGAESDKQFKRVLSLLSDWMKAGIVDVKVDTDGEVAFGLPDEMDELLGTQLPPGLAHDEVSSIIRNEIPALISASLEKKPERYLKRRLPEKFHEAIDVMIQRSLEAVEKLINKNLKERILLRRATMVYLLDDIQLTEGTYHLDLGKGKKVDVPHASLAFTFAKPGAGQVVVINANTGSASFISQDSIDVSVDLHKDDVKDLIKKLKTLPPWPHPKQW